MTTGDSHLNNHIRLTSQYQSLDVNYEYYESSAQRAHSPVFDVNGLNQTSQETEDIRYGAKFDGKESDVLKRANAVGSTRVNVQPP